MKGSICFLLVSAGLAFLIAGCANQSGGGAGASGGGQATGSTSPTASSSDIRDFNLRVRCPGIAELKKHGWSDQQIMQQLSVGQEDIPACEHWTQQQQHGYVPPPPPGTQAAAKPAAPAAASPAAAQ
ncbi:MAG: hypothetical protein ACLQDV_30210 [Candidatus Binataceae bacterium]